MYIVINKNNFAVHNYITAKFSLFKTWVITNKNKLSIYSYCSYYIKETKEYNKLFC